MLNAPGSKRIEPTLATQSGKRSKTIWRTRRVKALAPWEASSRFSMGVVPA
jgi:hypothetical protein